MIDRGKKKFVFWIFIGEVGRSLRFDFLVMIRRQRNIFTTKSSKIEASSESEILFLIIRMKYDISIFWRLSPPTHTPTKSFQNQFILHPLQFAHTLIFAVSLYRCLYGRKRLNMPGCTKTNICNVILLLTPPVDTNESDYCAITSALISSTLAVCDRIIDTRCYTVQPHLPPPPHPTPPPPPKPTLPI